MSENILICGVNWLGDNVMSMPAVSFLKKQEPDCSITVMVKASQRELWQLCPFVDDIIDLRYGFGGIMATIKDIRSKAPSRAYVFPNSFRSAFLPFAAGVKYRSGFAGHERSFLLTNVVRREDDPKRVHQAWEYMDILGLADKAIAEYGDSCLSIPELSIPSDVKEKMSALLRSEGAGDWVGMMPGAAHGPSKRWPVSHFVKVARSLVENGGYRICILGSPKEVDLCEEINKAAGVNAISLAGLTTVPELAALLSECRAVVCNDSGGMHLAAAVHTPVVALYGATDPRVTGPLGTGNRVIVNDNTDHSRDIKPDSDTAREALEAISPDRVQKALMEILKS